VQISAQTRVSVLPFLPSHQSNPVSTGIQLRAVLRALRQSRALTQEQAGRLLGVTQIRIAAIEKSPDVTGFGQISRLINALGGRLVVEVEEQVAPPAQSPKKKVKNAANW